MGYILISSILLLPTVASLPHPQYMGCYNDTGSEFKGAAVVTSSRALNGDFSYSNTSMTVDFCLRYCTQRGYLFAGLEYRFECWCGDYKYTEHAKLPDSECTSRCSGDLKPLCGGFWRLAIYTTVTFPTPSHPQYIGCFNDKGTEFKGENTPSSTRSLHGLFKYDYEGVLTVDLCISHCRQNGYIFAGVEAHFECFCGDHQYDKYGRVPDSECNSPCSGDSTIACGGVWRISVYSTLQKSEYMGCYNDKAGGLESYRKLSLNQRALRGAVEADWLKTYMTVDYCLNFCRRKGYKFAAMEYSIECWCGNDGYDRYGKAAPSECNSKCADNSNQICGGSDRISVYDTGVIIHRKCPPAISAVTSAQSGIASVDLSTYGVPGTVVKPAGVHPLQVQLGGLRCVLNLTVYDHRLVRQLTFRADYDIPCSSIGDESVRNALKSVAEFNYVQIANICKQDCSRGDKSYPSITCSHDTLTVVWPTSLTFSANVTNVPSDLQKILRARLISEGPILNMVIISRIPPIIAARRQSNGAYADVLLTSGCKDPLIYDSTTDTCL